MRLMYLFDKNNIQKLDLRLFIDKDLAAKFKLRRHDHIDKYLGHLI